MFQLMADIIVNTFHKLYSDFSSKRFGTVSLRVLYQSCFEVFVIISTLE